MIQKHVLHIPAMALPRFIDLFPLIGQLNQTGTTVILIHLTDNKTAFFQGIEHPTDSSRIDFKIVG